MYINCIFALVVHVIIFGDDDAHQQVYQDEISKQHYNCKKGHVVSWTASDQNSYVVPSLKCDALKQSQGGIAEIIKACHTAFGFRLDCRT